MSTPTKETHRYQGMWRPQFESLVEKWKANAKPQGPAARCECGEPLFAFDGLNIAIDRPKAMDHWLAGHFDEPVYEPLLRKYFPPKLPDDFEQLRAQVYEQALSNARGKSL